jgi:hypothetical protein
LTGTATERERRRDGRIEVGTESARRRPAGREPKVSLVADGSRAAEEARKASMPEKAAAVAAGAIERRRRKRRDRVWSGDWVMLMASPPPESGDQNRGAGVQSRN